MLGDDRQLPHALAHRSAHAAVTVTQCGGAIRKRSTEFLL